MGVSGSKIQVAVKTGDAAGFEAALRESPGGLAEVDSDGWTLLHWACYKAHNEMVRLLLARGLDPNSKCGRGWISGEHTPVHVAAQTGNAEAIISMCQHAANVNSRCQSGWTPLHYSVHEKQPAAAQALLACGADANALTPDSQTALDLAVKYDYPSMLPPLLGPTRAESRHKAFSDAVDRARLQCMRLFLTARAVDAETASACAARLNAAVAQHTNRLTRLSDDLASIRQAAATARGAAVAECSAHAHALTEKIAEVRLEIQRESDVSRELAQYAASQSVGAAIAASLQQRLGLGGAPLDAFASAAAAAASRATDGVPGVLGLLSWLADAGSSNAGGGNPSAPPSAPASARPPDAVEPRAPAAATAAAAAGGGGAGGGASSHRGPPGEDERACVVCLDAPKDTALIPCGHVLCAACAAAIHASARRICPVCRVGIAQTVRLFL